MSPSLSSMSVVGLIRGMSSGEISREEILESRLREIRLRNSALNAFITVLGKNPRPKRRRGALSGITVALKDNIYLARHRTSAGSKILRGFIPSYDADVAARLAGAGAFILGKTNLHEFAFGVTNVNPHFGPCRNPWRRDRVSGGSSGGSAVAVASGMACAAVGTDTAGSVRIPAALCGVVGYKPTTGLISRRGIVPLAWSLDTVGFLTRSVEDAALLASLTCERSSPRPRPRPRGLRGVRLGVPRNILEPLDDDVRSRYYEALDAARGDGAILVPFDFPYYREAIACRSLIVHAEAASFHSRWFAKRHGDYGSDVRKRIAQGLAIPATAYLDALRARGPLVTRYRSIFHKSDLVAMPTTRTPAPTIKSSQSGEGAAAVRAALLAFTEPFNVFGAPAVSIPCGLTREGLPVGLQLSADLYADDRLLSAAASLERLMPNILEKIPFGD